MGLARWAEPVQDIACHKQNWWRGDEHPISGGIQEEARSVKEERCKSGLDLGCRGCLGGARLWWCLGALWEGPWTGESCGASGGSVDAQPTLLSLCTLCRPRNTCR